MPDEFINFDGEIDEVLGWLEQAEQGLQSFDGDCEHQFPEVRTALERFQSARDAIKAIREPLLSHIQTAQRVRDEEESWTP